MSLLNKCAVPVYPSDSMISSKLNAIWPMAVDLDIRDEGHMSVDLEVRDSGHMGVDLDFSDAFHTYIDDRAVHNMAGYTTDSRRLHTD